MDLSIAATDAVGWTATTASIPANTHHLSFSATNSYIATIIAVSSTGGTLDTATSLFAQLLVPGTGWTGPTTPPGVVGNPTTHGYTAVQPVVCAWDNVPYDIATGSYNVAVVAFAGSGDLHLSIPIQYVTFSVNNGPWLTISEPAINPQNANSGDVGLNYDATGNGVYADGILEFWATLNAADFDDGPNIEVRAIAYPFIGQPVVLPTLILNANSHGSLNATPLYVSTTGSDSGDGTIGNPFLTIIKAAKTFGDCNNKTVRLLAGLTYDAVGIASGFPAPTNDTGWLTIEAAPGVAFDEVRIISSDSDHTLPSCLLVRYKGLSVYNTQIYQTQSGANQRIWLDGVFLSRASQDDGNQGFTTTWDGGAYHTNCEFTNCQTGMVNSVLARNSWLHGLSEAVFKYGFTYINCRVQDVAKVSTQHPDLVTGAGGISGLILYGVDATINMAAQGPNVNNLQLSALVDTNITTDTVGSWVSWWLQGIQIGNVVYNSDIGPRILEATVATDPTHPEVWYNEISSKDNFALNSTLTVGGSGTMPPGWTVS